MFGSLSAAALLSVAEAVLIALLALGPRPSRPTGGAGSPPDPGWGSVGAGLVAWLGATAALAGSGVLAD